MFVAIDFKNRRFLPIAHPDLNVVGDLVWVEAPRSQIHIERAEWPFLTTWGDLDLVMLYQNTTGQKATRVGDNLRAVLLELAQRVPAREVNAFELARQAELVPEKCSMYYLYAPGQLKPQELKSKKELDPLSLPRAQDEDAIVHRPRVRPVARELPPANTTPAPGSSARPVRAPSGPRMAGVRDLIWAVADKMWEAAGKPADVKVVLQLRKDMMGTLESEHGVKRTSSSNELGNWMKARI